MSSGETSMDTVMEDEDSFVSDTNAVVYAASDISGWTHSLISDNNITNSSSSTSVDDRHHQQQISNAASGGGDSMNVSSSASSRWFENNKQIDDQQQIRIFNVDFRALCSRSDFRSPLLADTGRTVNEEMACAEAIQENNFTLADVLISRSGKDTFNSQETCSLHAQNHSPCGANTDSSGLLLPTTVSNVATTSIDADMSSMPLGTSGLQNSLYGYVQDSSDLLHNLGQVDAQTATRTFVKVYKSGTFGRTLDINRFTSYPEMRQELGQMFGIEGFLEDSQRSGWNLVFVDRENDVLLLGEDPWEVFVNNVWYIKVLSSEDVQKLGKEEVESLNCGALERMTSNDSADGRDFMSGLLSIGSLEY